MQEVAGHEQGTTQICAHRIRDWPADERPSPEQQERYRQAASPLRQWMAEKDEEEDAVWPFVEKELKEIRVNFRG